MEWSSGSWEKGQPTFPKSKRSPRGLPMASLPHVSEHVTHIIGNHQGLCTVYPT